jgi:hypothetical protein
MRVVLAACEFEPLWAVRIAGPRRCAMLLVGSVYRWASREPLGSPSLTSTIASATVRKVLGPVECLLGARSTSQCP